MEDAVNVFNYNHLLSLIPRSSTYACQQVESFVIKEGKLWLVLREEFEEQVFLDAVGQLVALIKRSQIGYFW